MTEATKIHPVACGQGHPGIGHPGFGHPARTDRVLISQNSGEAGRGPYQYHHQGARSRHPHFRQKGRFTSRPTRSGAIEREVKSGRMAPDDTTLLGRLNCAAAGFISHRYGFRAAKLRCLRSLRDLPGRTAQRHPDDPERHHRCSHRRRGRGEAHPFAFSGISPPWEHFSAFPGRNDLLARPPAPSMLNEGRNGPPAKGGGMIVKSSRESLAPRTRGRVSMPSSPAWVSGNNHLGMVESRERRPRTTAMGASCRDTPMGPMQCDLVECHATMHPAGGRGGGPRPARPSSISSTAHRAPPHSNPRSDTPWAPRALTAHSGESRHEGGGLFPPTLNFKHPDPEIALNGSGLRIRPGAAGLDCAGPVMPRRLQDQRLRRFGGSNFVVQVSRPWMMRMRSWSLRAREPGLDREKADGLSRAPGVSFFRTEIDGHNCEWPLWRNPKIRPLAVIEEVGLLAEAGTSVKPGHPRQISGLGAAGDIHQAREDLPSLPLAFVFPGQGSQYAEWAGSSHESFHRHQTVDGSGRRRSGLRPPPLNVPRSRGDTFKKTAWQQPAMFALEHAMATGTSITPWAFTGGPLAGHSLGELTAL